MAGILTILGAWLAAAVLTAAMLSAVARTLGGERRSLSERGRRRRLDRYVQGTLLAAALAVTTQVSEAGDWQPTPLLFLLAALALASTATPLPLGSYRFSADFVSILLAMALLGPAPAVAIGVVCVVVDATRLKTGLDRTLNNLAAYATFALVGGLLLDPIHGTVALTAACFVVGVGVNLLNFLVIALHMRVRDGAPIGRAVRDTWLPVLHWEAATVAAGSATVYGFIVVGPGVVAGFGLSLAVLQLLAFRIAAARPAGHIVTS